MVSSWMMLIILSGAMLVCTGCGGWRYASEEERGQIISTIRKHEGLNAAFPPNEPWEDFIAIKVHKSDAVAWYSIDQGGQLGSTPMKTRLYNNPGGWTMLSRSTNWPWWQKSLWYIFGAK